jgi:guanylate kinase
MNLMERAGKLIIFSAPSGAGKSTLVRALFERVEGLDFSVSATTRTPRGGERDGKDYHFLTEDQFRKHIQAGDFIEYEEVYPGTFYGTLKREVDKGLAAGKHLVFDIDVMGGLRVKDLYRDQALAMFIMPPGLEQLSLRLQARGTETAASLQKRLDKAKWEISYSERFDHIINNDELNVAIAEVCKAVRRFIGS